MKFRIRTDAITLLHPTMEELGVLDIKTTNALRVLMTNNPFLDFEAFLDQESLGSSSQKRKTSSIPITINVYGSATSSHEVTSSLLQANILLQEPFHTRPSSTYFNPQFLSWDDDMITPRLRKTQLLRSADFAEEVDAIFGQSSSVVLCGNIRQDNRITTPLHKFDLIIRSCNT